MIHIREFLFKRILKFVMMEWVGEIIKCQKGWIK